MNNRRWSMYSCVTGGSAPFPLQPRQGLNGMWTVAPRLVQPLPGLDSVVVCPPVSVGAYSQIILKPSHINTHPAGMLRSVENRCPLCTASLRDADVFLMTVFYRATHPCGMYYWLIFELI